MTRIEQVVRTLAAERQEPLCAYIYDLARLRAHVSQLLTTLPGQCRLYYAVKSNSEAPVLEALAPIIHGFEVASLGEIRKVRGIDQRQPVVFGGPGKTDAEIIGAIEHGVDLLHIESLNELQRIEHLARQRGTIISALLRINLRGRLPQATLQMAGTPTQFGIDEEHIADAVELARHCPHVAIRGFHFHSISNQLDAGAHADLVGFYLTRAKAWADEFDLPIRVVNAGGGIGVNYADLGAQFDWATFVDRLTDVLADACLPDWTVLFECGRYLTASCGYYAAEVLDVKWNHGTPYVIIRGGTHHFRLPASWRHSHPFQVVPIDTWPYPFPRADVGDAAVTVVGQLCTPKDVLARDVFVPRVRLGDVILFQYTGAYGWSISHHDFLNHPHPEHIFLE